jgi:hypothetical protein
MQSSREVACNAGVTPDLFCFAGIRTLRMHVEGHTMTKELSTAKNSDFEKELAALARMVTHARQSANDLQIAMPTYCLDMALAAILEEMELHGIDLTKAGKKDKPIVAAAFH